MQVCVGKKILNGWFRHGNLAIFFTTKKLEDGLKVMAFNNHSIWATTIRCADSGKIEVLQGFDNMQEAMESVKSIEHIIFGKCRRT